MHISARRARARGTACWSSRRRARCSTSSNGSLLRRVTSRFACPSLTIAFANFVNFCGVVPPKALYQWLFTNPNPSSLRVTLRFSVRVTLQASRPTVSAPYRLPTAALRVRLPPQQYSGHLRAAGHAPPPESERGLRSPAKNASLFLVFPMFVPSLS